MSRTWLGLGVFALLFAVGCKPTESSNSKPTFSELKKEIIKPGKGEPVKQGDMVFMEYRGTLVDGTEFDSNLEADGAPLFVVLGAGSVIKGWDEGIVGMLPGEEAKLSVPSDMGYGPAGSPPKIPPAADLIFELKLLGVVRKGEETVYDSVDDKVGTGAEAVVGKKAEIHYTVAYLNDVVVDDSRKRGKTLNFTVGATSGDRVIAGIDDGVRGMKVGGKRTLMLPPGLIYGPSGNRAITGNQMVKVTLDLISVK